MRAIGHDGEIKAESIESGLVFTDIEGKPMLPDTVSRAWANLAVKAGLKGTVYMIQDIPTPPLCRSRA